MLRLELDGLLEEVRKHDARTIGIQLPAGLRQNARTISSFFESKGYDVIFSGNPSYGACDVSDRELFAAGADIVVHFGHTRMLISSSCPVIYWEVSDDIPIIDTIKNNVGTIMAMGGRVGLATTLQHVHKLAEVKEYLEGKGMEVAIGPPGSRVSYAGQVLGCSFETISGLDVDFIIYVGTGYFHPIGMSLASGKDVLYCDPYRGTCENVSDEKMRILKKRYAVMSKAKDKKHFAVIISTKKGQNRQEEALFIKKLLNRNGKDCQLIYAEEINGHIVQDFDFEAFVVAACPRIAIDDASSFDKPVLTLAEARMMYADDDYIFDEIRKI